MTLDLDPFTVVTVPFPFSDSKKLKKRPSVVISDSSFNRKVGQSVLAMITSAKNSAWPLDTRLVDIKSAGLPVPSVVRMKFFTVDHRLILDQLGTLSRGDQEKLAGNLKKLFSSLRLKM